jgi:hypothetical protein
MESRIAYCEVLDRDVEILHVRRHPSRAGEGPDALCMEVVPRCTRTVCPVCTVSPQAILAELTRLNALAH